MDVLYSLLLQKPSPRMNCWPSAPIGTSGKIIKGRSPGFQAWTLGGILGTSTPPYGWSMFQGKATLDHRALGLRGEEKVLPTSNASSV